MKEKFRTQQYKLSYILFAMLFVFFLFADFATPPLSESGIITAVGIENGENGEYVMTFVLAEMANDVKENHVVQVSAPTVAGGVNQLASQLGMTAKLSYAGLVLVEKSVAQGDIFNVISFFLNTSGVHDSASLMLCENSPAEIFSAQLATKKMGVEGLASLLKTAERSPISLPHVNLKDFAENYFTFGKDNALACVNIQKSNGENALNIASGYIFRNGKAIEKIQNGEVLAYNLLEKNGKNANFTIDKIDLGGVVSDVRLKIVSQDCNLEKINLENPLVNINCKLKVALIDQSNSQQTLSQISGIATAKDEIAQGVESYLKANITNLMAKSFKTNSDFLGIGEKLLRTDKNMREKLKANENYLQNAKINLQLEVEVLQNGRI